MKIQFIGATHEVTGSCTLLEINNRYFLVDCGMEQARMFFKTSVFRLPQIKLIPFF